MKTLKNDELFEILQRKLESLQAETQSSEELISETADEYLERLLLRGNIPHHFIEDIAEDLKAEVTDMYRKKTYGHMDLKNYKSSQKNKSRPRSA